MQCYTDTLLCECRNSEQGTCFHSLINGMAPLLQGQCVVTGKGTIGGQLAGAQVLGSPQGLGTRPSAQTPGQDLDERAPAEQGLSPKPDKEVCSLMTFADAAIVNQDCPYYLPLACNVREVILALL